MTETKKRLNLSGQVRHQGMPVSGVRVRLFQQYQLDGSGSFLASSPLDVKETARKGEFEFHVPPGFYCLEAIPKSDNRLLKCKVENIRVDKSSTTYDIGLKPGTVLRGTVATTSGEHVRHGEIMALGVEPSSYWSLAQIEEDGSFSLVLPRGRFQLLARSSPGEDDTDSSGNEFAFLSTSLGVIDVYGDEALELVLPDLLRFAGEVVDVFGHPVVDAIVTLEPTEQESGSSISELNLDVSTHTNDKGKFELFVEPGIYDLSIQPRDATKHFGIREDSVRITSAAIRKYALEEGYRLEGAVNFEDAPLPNCLVRVQATDSDREFITKTDPGGRFGVSLPGGIYLLVVSAHPKNSPTVKIDGAEHSGLAPWARMITVSGDTHAEVRLKTGTALRGRVLDDSGQARSGVKVSVFALEEEEKSDSQEPAGERLNRALAHAVTDSDGRYSIFLSPGDYFLVVHKDFDHGVRIKMGQEPANVDINWHGWCQVRFELTGEDDARVPRCQVKYHPYGQHDEEQEGDSHLPFGYVMTGDDGKCCLTLPAGVYSFLFSPPQAGSYDSKNIRQLSISKDLSKKVILPLKSGDPD